MKLDSCVFELDLDRIIPVIETFIAAKMNELGRRGIVVPLSGGLDSSTVAALFAQSVGRDKVIALLLPDRQGAPDAIKFATLVADRLGIKTVRQDTTKLNKSGGVYDFIANKVPNKKLGASVVRRYLVGDNGNFYLAGIAGTDHQLTREALASIYAKQRLRMVTTYHYAELHRLMVVGSAHKSEDLLGLFVKFGVDDVADLMPLKMLYRSQVLAIAARVGVPTEVLERSPNPEMLPGIEDKYQDVLHVSSEVVDLVLWGIEQGLDDAFIAESVALPVAKVAELRDIVRLSAHMRHPSQFPQL